MKLTVARVTELLILLGSIAGLASVLFLQFGRDPVRLAPENGIQLMQIYSELMPSDKNVLTIGQSTHLPFSPSMISYWSVLGIIIVFTLVILLSLFTIVRRKPTFITPVLCLVLSLLTVPLLFLVFYAFTSESIYTNFLQQMFDSQLPLASFGWWISAAALLLTFIASLLTLTGYRPAPSIRRA